MQKKRLSFSLAASVIAGFFAFATPSFSFDPTPGQQPSFGCSPSQNEISLTFADDRDGDDLPSQAYCKAINNDIQIKSISRAVRQRGIVYAKVKTEGEAGSCTFYLITAQGDLHRKFNIRNYQDEKTTARPNTYFGFRLGC